MLINKKESLIYLSICLVFFLLLGASACNDEILEIEQRNTYSWQKYMNEEEYKKLQKGMSYMEVVRISGGAGKEIKKDIYEWNDELVLTKGYRLQFKDDQLVEMEVVERRGNSTR